MMHEVTADITEGEVKARTVHRGDPAPEFRVSDLRYGTWSCTCGKEGMSDREAVDHLREVGQA